MSAPQTIVTPNLLARSTVHLLLVEPATGEPKSFGSGCLVNYKERVFLLSVAHVTDFAGLKTCIETGQPPVGNSTPLYCPGTMQYADEYRVKSDLPKSITSLDDVVGDLIETLDITCCEMKDFVPTMFLQPALNNGKIKIDAGQKLVHSLADAVAPARSGEYGLCGRIEQRIVGNQIQSNVTFKTKIKYQGTKGRFHRFVVPRLINLTDYEGCSGTPILDAQGRLVALASKVMEGTQLLYGFSIEECRNLLDVAIHSGQV
jgi:hypothetical protein